MSQLDPWDAPLLGEAGHVHLLQIDQIVGHNYLITVHGPINPIVDATEMLVETRAVLKRIESGRFQPSSPAELSYAIGSAIARRQRAVIGDVAEKLPELEIKVMAPSFREPEELLEQMFLVRHELTTKGAFMAKNRALLDEVQRLRDKARRSDMLADDHALASFFESRIPDDVHSGATFEARKATFAKFQDRVYDQVLFLKFGDLTRKQAARANVQGFVPYRIPRMWNVWFEG